MSDHGAAPNDAGNSGEIKSKTAFRSSFFVVLILAFLFIAALNFIRVMSKESPEGNEAKEPSSSVMVHEGGQPVGKNDTAAVKAVGVDSVKGSEAAHP